MNTRLSIFLALLIVAAVALLLRPADDLDSGQAVVRRRGDDPSAAAERAPDLAGAAELERRVAMDPDRGASEAADATESRARSGRLRLRVLDARTGSDASGIGLRGASATRFIERTLSSPFELNLTPGEWTFSLRQRAHDDLTLPEVRIPSGAVRDLGSVTLPAGTASIRGHVSDARGASREFRVRLGGRRQFACPAHPGQDEPGCTKCRRGWFHTERPVRAGDSFVFAGLTAGWYWLSVHSEAQGVLLTRSIVLERGAAVRSDVDLSFTAVTLALSGAAGDPFAGEWVEDGVAYGAPIRFFFYDDDRCCAAAHSFDASNGGATRRTPPVPDGWDDLALLLEQEDDQRTVMVGDAWSTDVVVIQDSFESSEGDPSMAADGDRLEWPPAEDRLRTDDPATVPPRPIPSPTPRVRSLPARRVARGVFEVEDVPDTAQRLLVFCGPHFAVVDLAPTPLGPEERVECRIGQRCGAPADLFLEPTDCASCHWGMPETQLVD